MSERERGRSLSAENVPSLSLTPRDARGKAYADLRAAEAARGAGFRCEDDGARRLPPSPSLARIRAATRDRARVRRYDYVLLVRCDSYWFGDVAPLPGDAAPALAAAAAPPLPADKVATKRCLEWGGVNDKARETFSPLSPRRTRVLPR